MFLSGWR